MLPDLGIVDHEVGDLPLALVQVDLELVPLALLLLVGVVEEGPGVGRQRVQLCLQSVEQNRFGVLADEHRLGLEVILGEHLLRVAGGVVPEGGDRLLDRVHGLVGQDVRPLVEFLRDG